MREVFRKKAQATKTAVALVAIILTLLVWRIIAADKTQPGPRARNSGLKGAPTLTVEGFVRDFRKEGAFSTAAGNKEAQGEGRRGRASPQTK